MCSPKEESVEKRTTFLLMYPTGGWQESNSPCNVCFPSVAERVQLVAPTEGGWIAGSDLVQLERGTQPTPVVVLR